MISWPSSRASLGPSGIAIGIDQHLGAHVGGVAPGEAVGDRDRQHAVLAFHRHQLVDEAAHRFAAGVHDRDELAIEHAARWPDASALATHRSTSSARSRMSVWGIPVATMRSADSIHGRHQLVDEAAHRFAAGVHDRDELAIEHAARLDARPPQVDQLIGAVQDVGMGYSLVADDEVGGFHHGRGQMAVRIQFRADHVRADDLARAAQQVALAIVVAVGHHRAVQAEQRHVHGAGVAGPAAARRAAFQGVASGDAGRHGGGGQAFDQRPVLPWRCRAAHSGPASSACGPDAGRPV